MPKFLKRKHIGECASQQALPKRTKDSGCRDIIATRFPTRCKSGRDPQKLITQNKPEPPTFRPSRRIRSPARPSEQASEAESWWWGRMIQSCYTGLRLDLACLTSTGNHWRRKCGFARFVVAFSKSECVWYFAFLHSTDPHTIKPLAQETGIPCDATKLSLLSIKSWPFIL